MKNGNINSNKQQSQDNMKGTSTNQQSNAKDETKKYQVTIESSTSGPTTQQQSYDVSAYGKNSLLPSNVSTTAPTNHQYKHYSSISTSKSSPMDKYSSSNGTTANGSEKRETKNGGDNDDITLYKPITYSLSSTTSPSSSSTTSASTSSTTNSDTKTTTVVTVNGKHKITNNFKLPPFPVYVPSTDLPSFSLTSSTNSLASQKNDTTSSTSGYSSTSKYSDSTSAITSSYSTTLGRLANASSSPSRTISTSANTPNTNTLPLHLGRTNPYVYQSDSNNFNNTTTTSSISPMTSSTSSTTSSFLSQSNYNSIYSTLPKTTPGSSYTSKFDTVKDSTSSSYSYNSYSTDYYSNLATTNNNTSSNNTSTYTSGSNAASENIYRVQYSATNPFLDPIDTNSSSADNTSSSFTASRNGNSHHHHGGSGLSVSEIARKFEKLDSEEDLK